jgi:hypothetical protein
MTDCSDLSAFDLQKKITATFNIDVSVSGVSAFRRRIGWTQQKTRYCQLIRNVNKEKRVLWAREQLASNEQFDNVIFTDESKVEIARCSRRSFRKVGQPIPRQAKPKHPLSVLVWGGISKRGPTPLLIFNGIMDSIFYQNEILQNSLLPFTDCTFPDGFRLYQDNDPKHTSKSTVAFMEENGIPWFKSPAESPDLNPIENLWAEMKHYIASKAKPFTKDELENALQTWWQVNVTVEKCQRYINHIHKVLPAVIESDGGPTRF